MKKIKKKEEEEKKEDKEEEEEVGRGSREEKGEGGWRELQSIDMHGSMMVQELLRMDDPGVLLQSLRHFSMSEKIFLASHCSGCRVVEALMVSATVPEEEKRWWLKTFKVGSLWGSCGYAGGGGGFHDLGCSWLAQKHSTQSSTSHSTQSPIQLHQQRSPKQLHQQHPPEQL